MSLVESITPTTRLGSVGGGPSRAKLTHGHVCVGGLDTNDLDEAEDYFDGGISSGYVDDRTGLMLDENLTRQAEAEEMDFMKKIQLYDVVETAECWERTGNPPRRDQVGKGEQRDLRGARCSLQISSAGLQAERREGP